MPHGCYNSTLIKAIIGHKVVFQVNTNCVVFSHDNVLFYTGHAIAQIHLIMCLVPQQYSETFAGLDIFLAYIQQFDIIPQCSLTLTARHAQLNPVTGMYLVKHGLQTDGTVIGDVLPLSQCRVPIEVMP
jgi:hypothetical protein